MRGKIEQVWENESRKGQKYITVQIGGEKYSVWDNKYFDHLQEGAEIEYEIRKSGDYMNLNDIKPVDDLPPVSYQPNGKDRQITRLSCLKSASEIIAPLHLDLDEKRDLVVDTAKIFERYVNENSSSNQRIEK
jgi:hypothetical protein